jgi:hypothetical protein
MDEDTFFQDASRSDQCVSQEPPASGIEHIRPLLEDPALRAYFFKNLQQPSWLSTLRKNKFFAAPPPEGVWPQAGYLFRMAKIETHQKSVK